jgi:hypothetical protein
MEVATARIAGVIEQTENDALVFENTQMHSEGALQVRKSIEYWENEDRETG